MKVTERQQLNVFEMKCLRSMTGVSRLHRVTSEVMRARTGVRRELAARVDMNAGLYPEFFLGGGGGGRVFFPKTGSFLL